MMKRLGNDQWGQPYYLYTAFITVDIIYLYSGQEYMQIAEHSTFPALSEALDALTVRT